MSPKRSTGTRRRPPGRRGPRRPVSLPEQPLAAGQDEAEAVGSLEAEIEAELEAEVEEELAEVLEEELETELETELEEELRLEADQAVLGALAEASQALLEAEAALADALGTVAQAERQLTDAQSAVGKALTCVGEAEDGVAAMVLSEPPEGRSGVIFESPEGGLPEDGAADARSAERKKPKAPESGIVAQARAVERQARALAEAQRPTGDPGD